METLTILCGLSTTQELACFHGDKPSLHGLLQQSSCITIPSIRNVLLKSQTNPKLSEFFFLGAFFIYFNLYLWRQYNLVMLININGCQNLRRKKYVFRWIDFMVCCCWMNKHKGLKSWMRVIIKYVSITCKYYMCNSTHVIL